MWAEAPKVLAIRIRLPAAAYWAWMDWIKSGFSRFSASGLAPRGRPAACSMVPMAPSSRMVVGEENSCSALTGYASLSVFTFFPQGTVGTACPLAGDRHIAETHHCSDALAGEHQEGIGDIQADALGGIQQGPQSGAGR